MTDLFLVRHGVTELNLNHIIIGRTNPPLHPFGQTQARAAGEHLASVPFAAIVSSPLQRAYDTARAIAAHHEGLDVMPRDGLMEIDFGVVDGMPTEEARSQYRTAFAQADNPDTPDFGFPGGETWSHIAARMEDTLQALVEDYPDNSVCAVAHGGCLGLWLAKMMGDPLGNYRSWIPLHASITHVRVEKDRFHIVSFSDTSHLPADLQNVIQDLRVNRLDKKES